ncbi:MAG: hypothetical protein J5601_00890 [Elusimicrobiaceae bacterium]|nr:hypothetical protein [Elusimicrobiaceae bacterium]
MCLPAFATNTPQFSVEKTTNKRAEYASNLNEYIDHCNQLHRELFKALQNQDYNRQAELWREIRELRKTMTEFSWKKFVEQFQADVETTEKYLKMYVQLYRQKREELEKALDDDDFDLQKTLWDDLTDIFNVISSIRKKMQTGAFITTKTVQEMEEAKNANYSPSHFMEKLLQSQETNIASGVRSVEELAAKLENEEDGIKFEDLIGYIRPIDQDFLPPTDPQLVAAAATLLGNTVEAIPLVVGKNKTEDIKTFLTNKDVWNAKHAYRVDFVYIQAVLLRKINELKEKENPDILDLLALGELRTSLLKIIKIHLNNDIPNPVTLHDKNVKSSETGYGKFEAGDDNPEKQRASQIALLDKMQNEFFTELEGYLKKARANKNGVDFKRATYLASIATKYTLLNDPKKLTDLVKLVDQARGDYKTGFGLINTGLDEFGGEKMDYHFAPVIAAIFSTAGGMAQQSSISDDSLQIIMDQLVDFVGQSDKDSSYILPTRVAALETASFFTQRYMGLKSSLQKTTEGLPIDIGPFWVGLPLLSTDLREFFTKRAMDVYCPLVKEVGPYTNTIYGLSSSQATTLADRLKEVVDRFYPDSRGAVITMPGQGPRHSYPCTLQDNNKNQSLQVAEYTHATVMFFGEAVLWVFLPEWVFTKVGRVYRLARGAVAALPRSVEEGVKAFKTARQVSREMKTIKYGKQWKPAVEELRGTATRQVAEQVAAGLGVGAEEFVAAEAGSLAAKEGARWGVETAVAGGTGAGVGTAVSTVAQDEIVQAMAKSPFKAFWDVFLNTEGKAANASELIRGYGAKRNVVTFYTYEEKNGVLVEKVIDGNGTLKQLIKSGKLEKNGFYAMQPDIEGNITRWAIPVPKKATYVDIGNAALQKSQWTVVSGNPARIVQEYNSGMRNLIAERARLIREIEAGIQEQGGLDIYVAMEDGTARLLTDLEKKAPQFVAQMSDETTLYILPKGSLMKSSVEGTALIESPTGATATWAQGASKSAAKGLEGVPFEKVSVVEASGGVTTTLAQWKAAEFTAFPEGLQRAFPLSPKTGLTEVERGLIPAPTNEWEQFILTFEGELLKRPDPKEIVASILYYTQQHAAAKMATTPILLGGSGLLPNVGNALMKVAPQVKVAPAFARATIPQTADWYFFRVTLPDWAPESSKVLLFHAKRAAKSNVAAQLIFFGGLMGLDHVAAVQEWFLLLSGFYARNDLEEALEATPALKEKMKETEKEAASGQKNSPKQGSIVTDALKPGDSHAGVAFFLALLPIWRAYTETTDYLGIPGEWSKLRFVKEGQKEEFLLNNFYVSFEKVLGNYTKQVVKEVGIGKIILSFDEAKLEVEKTIQPLFEVDNKLAGYMTTIFEHAKENIKTFGSENVTRVTQWLREDQLMAIQKATISSQLVRTNEGTKQQEKDTLALQQLDRALERSLLKVQEIRHDTKKTFEQKEKALQEEYRNTKEDLGLIVDFSGFAQEAFTSKIPDAERKQKISEIYRQARETIRKSPSFDERKKARNTARAEIDSMIREAQLESFFNEPKPYLYIALDPEFKDQVEKAWNEHKKARRAIYLNDALSLQQQEEKLKNEAIAFSNSSEKMMNEEEIKIYLTKDGLRNGLALVYSQYEKEVREIYAKRNQDLKAIYQDQTQGIDVQNQKAQERIDSADRELMLLTSDYTEKAAKSKNFWAQFATIGANQETWNKTVHDVLTKDLILLGGELEALGIEVTPKIQNDMMNKYDNFRQALEEIYKSDEKDKMMADFMYLKVAYKGALISASRHHREDRELWK